MKPYVRSEVWKIHAKLQNEYQHKINKLNAEIVRLNKKLERKERNIEAQSIVLSHYMDELNQLRPLLTSYVIRKHKQLNNQ